MVISPPRTLNTVNPTLVSKNATPPLPPLHYPPSGRLHKRKPSSLSVSNNTKARKLIEFSHHLVLMKTLSTRIHSVFDSIKMRGSSRSSLGSADGSTHRLGRMDVLMHHNESPTPSSTSSPKLGLNATGAAGRRDVHSTGMLVDGHYPADLDLKDLNHSSTDFGDDADDYNHLLNTPVRTIRSDRADDGSPTVTRIKPHALSHSSPVTINLSSPPTTLTTTALSLGTLEYDDAEAEDDDESRWSCIALDSRMSLNEDVGSIGSSERRSLAAVGLGVSSSSSNANQFITVAAPTSTAVSRASISTESSTKEGTTSKRDTRSTLFDWSEQQHLEKPTGGKSPPRPRTVHGKKDHVDRGSRSVGRRPTSGLHARSQSVPVAPGMAGKREPVVTNKFGTWGVGSKGVSEDWDEDFDFEDDSGPLQSLSTGNIEEKRVDSGSMRIPQTIRDQQVKVVNNIGLVRDFGLLIEELKGIRHRLDESSTSEFPKTELWREIDAMIELADREVDDPFPLKDSPPTPNEFDPFEEAQLSFTETPVTQTPPSQPWHTPNPRRSRSQRRSVLPYENNDVFSTPTSQTTSTLVLNSSPANTITPPGLTRPRKDSEAMARSVIEALHRRKDTQDPTLTIKPVPAQQKVLFDTNTLRYIVSHVQDLLKKVKADLPLEITQGVDLKSNEFETPVATSLPTQAAPLERLFRSSPSWPQPSMRRRLDLVEDGDEMEVDDKMDWT